MTSGAKFFGVVVAKMAKDKEIKTNAMRILDKLKLPYKVHLYECGEFIDGVHIAELLGEDCASCLKTLVTVGKSGNYYVFVLPVDKELDMKKCARAVGEKSLEMVHVKDINAVTGYIRGGCTPVGMKKQYKTVIHKTALDFESIIVSGGKLGAQLELAPSDLARACQGVFEDIIAD